MSITESLDPIRQARVESRLQTNLMAWLTSISPDGRPDSVPVWFLHQPHDDTILLYSQPGKHKLRNIKTNNHVALGLDVTDIGRDIIRFEGTAIHAVGHPPANLVEAYSSKYAERVAAIFGTIEHFATLFSEPILITPSRLHA